MKLRRLGMIFLAICCMFGCTKQATTQVDTDVESVLEDTVITLYDKDYDVTKNVKTYMFIGVDKGGNESGEGEYVGNLADFILLLVVDQSDKTYSLLQINRDTMTDIYAMSGDSLEFFDDVQICEAHTAGSNEKESSEITVDNVSSLLGGITIDGYYTLPMDYVKEINHAVGGVEVTVDGDLTNADPELKDGTTLTLSDDQAMIYCCRRMDVDDGKNTSRMRRQRQYLSALKEKVLDQLKEDKSFVNDLMDDLSDVSCTNVKNNTVSKIVNYVGSYEDKGIFTFEGTSKIGKALSDGEDHEEFYLDEDSVVDVMTQLYGLKEVEE